jgi:hypothetical protein
VKPDHLTPRETAAVLKLKHVGTLENWRREKPPKGPKWVHHGRNVLYPIVEVEAYVKANFLEPETRADRQGVDVVSVAAK